MKRKETYDLEDLKNLPDGAFDLEGDEASLIDGLTKSARNSRKSSGQTALRSSEGKESKSGLSKTLGNSKVIRFAEDDQIPTNEADFSSKKNASRTLAKKKPKKAHSDSESESASEYGCLRKLNRVLDDSANIDVFESQRTTYLNVMIAGEAKLCKNGFIRFLFGEVFNTQMPVFNPDEKINEATVSRTVRKQTKVSTFAHVLGFSQDFAVKDWSRLIKNYLKEKMDIYSSMSKLYSKKSDSQVIDMRVHMILFFVKSPKLRLNEITVLKKLQKYAVIIPVIIDKKPEAVLNSDYVLAIKTNILKEMAAYQVTPLSLDYDQSLQKIRDNLIGASPPFFVSAPNGIIDAQSNFSDLSQLIKLITSPFVSSYYLQTELLYSKHLERRSAKIEKQQKKENEEDEGEHKKGFGFGFALGVGIVGALVALKNKLI